MIGVIENQMSVVAEKLRGIEVETSFEMGSFTLFALIEREDSFGSWDVVISAKWIKDEKALIKTLASKISRDLSKDEQLMLSRIVVLPSTDPFVKNLNMVGVEHGKVKLSNNTFNGIFVKEAYLITSKSQ
ncbi:hypothetical protein BH20ACI1_BH20ACI1_25470 [soil metagenome]